MTVLTGPWRCPAASTSLVLDPLVSGIHTVAPPPSVPELVPPAAQTSWRRLSSPAGSYRGPRCRPGPSVVKAAGPSRDGPAGGSLLEVGVRHLVAGDLGHVEQRLVLRVGGDHAPAVERQLIGVA